VVASVQELYDNRLFGAAATSGLLLSVSRAGCPPRANAFRPFHNTFPPAETLSFPDKVNTYLIFVIEQSATLLCLA